MLGDNPGFTLMMMGGSLLGVWIGARLLGIVPDAVLLPMLAAILVISAVKVWRHQQADGSTAWT